MNGNTTPTFCTVDGCRPLQGQHKPDCGAPCDCHCHDGAGGAYPCNIPGGCWPNHQDDECPGCLPRLITPGLAVCSHCEATAGRALDVFPDLWVELGGKPRTASISGRGGSGGGDPEACPDCDNGRPCNRRHRGNPAPLPSAQVGARSTIRAHLITWAQILADDHGVTLPDEEAIVRATRQRAAHHSGLATQARNLAFILAWPTDPRTPPDPEAAAAMHVEAHKHAAEADRARTDRETGRDIITALCDHLRRHLQTLLAHPDKGPLLAADLRAASRQAWSSTPRARRKGVTFPCPTCGHHVHLDPDDQSDVRCPLCGATGDAKWWVNQAPAMTDQPTTITGIQEWLFANRGLDVPIETIRTWSKRVDKDTGQPIWAPTGRDERGRKLYLPLQAVTFLELRSSTRWRAS